MVVALLALVPAVPPVVRFSDLPYVATSTGGGGTQLNPPTDRRPILEVVKNPFQLPYLATFVSSSDLDLSNSTKISK